MRVRRSLVIVGLVLALTGIALGRSAPGHAQAATWTVRATLPVPVTGAAASIGLDGKIYIFGGNTFAQSVTTAEVFDPATNTVTPIAPLPVGLSFMSATLGYDGKIYIAGGWEGSETTGQSVGTLLAYDPTTNTYACSFSAPGCASATLAPLPLPVSEEGVAAGLDGLIYVVGGFATAPTNMVQVYDPVKNVWYQGRNYPIADAGLRAVVSPGGILYAGLGFDGQNYVNAIHYAASWETGTGSTQARLRDQQVGNPPGGMWDEPPSPHDYVPPANPFPPWMGIDPEQIRRQFPGLYGPPPNGDRPPIGPIEEPFDPSDGDKYASLGVTVGGAGGGASPLEGVVQIAGRSDRAHAADLSPLDQTYYGTDPADLYVMGGETNGTVSSAVSVYHLATRSWDTGPNLPSPTEDATTATAGGVLYLIGGDNGNRPSSAILGYNAPTPPGPPASTPTPTATSPTVPATATATSTPTPSPTPTGTPTPSPTPANTPIPLTAQLHVAHRSVKAGRRQTVTVQTEPGASVSIVVRFPSGKTLRHAGTAGATGRFTWRFKEPKHADKGKRRRVSVQVTVSDAAGQTASSSAHYSG